CVATAPRPGGANGGCQKKSPPVEQGAADEEQSREQAKKARGSSGHGARPGEGTAAAARVRQLLLGMVAGMTVTKHDLMEWVHEVGLAALREIFEADATAIAGPKGKHLADRTHHRWGTTDTELPFGVRRIQVQRP